MQQLIKWIDPVNAATEHQKVSIFIRGFDSHYKFHIRATNSVILTAVVNTAKGFELSYNELATQPIGIVQNNNNKKIIALLGEMQKQISMFGSQNQTNNWNNNRGNQ